MNSSLVKKRHRNPEIIFYDVTNFFFEIEYPDEDILDEDGNLVDKVNRKMGVSKTESSRSFRWVYSWTIRDSRS